MDSDIPQILDEKAELRRENTILRGMVAKLGKSCHYCGITNIAECVRGFPGCALADDLLCADDEVGRTLATENAKLRVLVEPLEKLVADQQLQLGEARSARVALEQRNRRVMEQMQRIMDSKVGVVPCEFQVGDTVERVSSDYKFPGTVVSTFVKLSGAVRLVVEDDRGTLFIQSASNLKARTP